MNAENISIDASPVTPKGLADLLALVEEGVISGKIAKTVFDDMAKTGKNLHRISFRRKGWFRFEIRTPSKLPWTR